MRILSIAFLAGLVLFPITPARAHEDHDAAPLLGAIFPQLSRDGETIVFSHQGAIWRTARAGGAATRLSSGSGFDALPALSPDGRRLAFTRGTGAFSGPVHIINAETLEPIAIPKRPVAKDKLFFDATGNRLLSNFRRGGGRFGLCWFDMKTGELGDELRPDQWGLKYALSHDDKSIALITTHDVRGEQGGNNGPQCDLWTLPSSGGETRHVGEFPGRLYDVSWAHDGKSLVVVSNVGGAHNDLWRVSAADGSAEKLTFGQADEDNPSFAATPRWLLYTDNRRGPTALVVRDSQNDSQSIVRVSHFDYGRPTGELRIAVNDRDEKRPTAARISVQLKNGKYFAPRDAIYRMLRGQVHFYAGAASLHLPAGDYTVTVARGPEYPVVRREVTVGADNAESIAIQLGRWTNQSAAQWYSGESHIHANYGYGQWYNSPRTMYLQSSGEDLNVSNFMVANSEADGVFDREYFRGAPDPLSRGNTILYWNEEFRSTIWGHLTLLNLKYLVEPIFTGFARTTHPHDHPTNSDVADFTHDQGAHVNYTHPAHNVQDPYLSAYSAKALPLDVALGKIDSIDVMGSNHVATMPLWYRLLNCGFHVPASAGTDCFLNRVRSRLPGQARVYVHVDGEFNYERWTAGLRAGRTFVTNAPMFDFKVNGKMSGETIELGKPGDVKLSATVRSHHPLDRVEVIVNGKVIHSEKLDSPQQQVVVERAIAVDRSGWIAVRAQGPSHPDQPSGSVFGHTSPVYLHVADRPVDAREDAAYFVRWIDRLRTDVRRRNRIPSRHQEHVESQIAAAREVFNRLLEDD
ncbi:MAG: CehA/McbA family metallohydrolase [Pirellulaceae bacterium]|jgi:hypothetical protein|nr:CehA/McbA family metallohydrolase [Pirellulaceae bacterium]MDP7019904.1 CehA/McbA family metallohydrolase [Pirellulaceae bacterium]